MCNSAMFQFQSPYRQRLRETELLREEQQKEIDEWRENRTEVSVIEEGHIGIYLDAHTHTVSSRSDCMLEFTTTFPVLDVNLPVAIPPRAFSVPVLSLGLEPEQLLYDDVLTTTAEHSYLIEVASDHEVGGFNRKRCMGHSCFCT